MSQFQAWSSAAFLNTIARVGLTNGRTRDDQIATRRLTP